MIRSLNVKGLNHRLDVDLVFNEDLNIITGKNGSGKTTLLKLLWYLISGNLERIIPEIPFHSVSIDTDSFTLSIVKEDADDILVVSQFPGQERSTTVESLEDIDHILDDLNRLIARATKKSLFFPTFRRIEGGFHAQGPVSFADAIYITEFDRHPFGRPRSTFANRATDRLQEAMSHLSEGLSVYDHKFIASISTHDIVELLREKYADISDKTNEGHYSENF